MKINCNYELRYIEGLTIVLNQGTINESMKFIIW